jgi:hypothetical protein
MKTPKTPKTPRVALLTVTPTNLKKTADRVLNGQNLVSPEIAYIVKNLGTRATQEQLDKIVLQVRSMPWAKIAPAE